MASPVTPKAAMSVVKAEPPKVKPSTGKSSGKLAFSQSPSSKFPGTHPATSKSLSGLSSPRKSIFNKSGGIKLGSAQSPNKSPSKLFFGKAPTGVKPSGQGQFDLPLALRKKRRPNAGMKRETHIIMDKNLTLPKTPKDGKMPQKRKLSQSSPNSGKIGAKHKDDYVPPSSKKRKILRSNRDQDSRNDFYCWVCHKEGSVICCELCPRVYHPKCAKLERDPFGDWFCPECERATNAECVDSQSKAMASLTLDQLAKLLLFALKRMKHSGAEPFLKPVNLQQNPGYEEFVFNPMDLSTLEKNIKKRMYGSTEAFLLDAKWILHNCIVFNGSHHKLTNSARMIIKICEYEVKEVEICPDCYMSACLKRDKWFCEVCRDPHKLVWARLQGFPFWPSKVIRERDGQVDVRFFGQHDRAWVPMNSCFMYSPEIPCQPKKKATGLSSSVAEMELHIQNLQKTFGKDCFVYAPYRAPYGQVECLTINTADGQKWSGSKMGTGSLINGIHDRSSPKPDVNASTVKVKMEPIGMEAVDEEAGESPKVSSSKSESNKVLDRDTNGAATIDKYQEPTNEKSSLVSNNNEGGKNNNHSRSTSPNFSPRNSQDFPDKEDTKDGTRNPVRRQVFTIARKRTGGDRNTTLKTTSDASYGLKGGLSLGKTSDGNNAESDNSGASSPSKAPVGVFEVSDESLDVDPEVEVQSPSIQLLGKTHISKNDFGRCLAIKLNKVSPRSLGKMRKVHSRDDEEAKEESTTEKMIEEEEMYQKDTSVSATKNNPNKVISESSKLSDDLESTECKGESGVDKPQDSRMKRASPVDEIINESCKQNLAETQKSDSEEPLETSNPDEDMPSTSQSTPTKDKFHIKLGKTIETMKASLGIERLHSVEKESSDSESSDSDSDSSEADHSEESDMEVDDGSVDKISSESPITDETKKSGKDDAKDTSTHQENQTKQDFEESGSKHGDRNTSSCKIDSESKVGQDQTISNPQTSSISPNDAVESATLEKSKNLAGPSTSRDDTTANTDASKSIMDSDIDLLMSCHSEMSDSDEGDLVIDESSTVKEPIETRQPSVNSITTKDSNCEKCDLHTDTNTEKIDIHDEYQAPMDTDDVILVSDPFEKADNGNDRNNTKQTSETSPMPDVQEHETKSSSTDSANIPKTIPSTNTPPSSNKQLKVVVTNRNSSNVHLKPFIPSVDPARSSEAPLSSFPQIVETLKAGKRETNETDQPKMGGGADSENNVLVTDKDAAKTTQKNSTHVMKTKDSQQVSLYQKYIEKISTAVEGMLNDFSKDMSEGMLLKDAKSCIDDLKMEVQRLRWEREQEKVEYKQIMDLAIAEMKECLEAEAKVAMDNLKSQLETEKQEEIRKTKSKQWCAMCGKDAVFFCCWNTSYCDYPCQQTHWPVHRNSCQQRALGNTVVQVQQLHNKPQQPSQQVQMHIRTPSIQPMSQQQINQSTHQPIQQNIQQQVQQAMQQSPASTQPMQTLIQYVQAPRMSAPVPVSQLINHHPYTMTAGRVVGSGGMRIIRP